MTAICALMISYNILNTFRFLLVLPQWTKPSSLYFNCSSNISSVDMIIIADPQISVRVDLK
jgi:hypothetical protein